MSFEAQEKIALVDKFIKNVNSSAASKKSINSYDGNPAYKDAFTSAMAMLDTAQTVAELYAKVSTKPDKSNSYYANQLMDIIPDLLHIVVECPIFFTSKLPWESTGQTAYCTQKYQLWDLIQHMNDFHKTSREDIADFLDNLQDAGIVNLTMNNHNPDRG